MRRLLQTFFLSSVLYSCAYAQDVTEAGTRTFSKSMLEIFTIKKAKVIGSERDGKKFDYTQWNFYKENHNELSTLPLSLRTFSYGASGHHPTLQGDSDLHSSSAFYNLNLNFGWQIPWDLGIFNQNLFLDLGMHIDPQSHSTNYTLCDLSLYSLWPKEDGSSFILGLWAEFGRFSKWRLPILGISYTIDELWKVNAIFPKGLEIHYAPPASQWAFKAFLDTFKVRYRFHKDDNNAFGAWEYRSYKAGLKTTYTINEAVDLSLDLGHNLNPSLNTYRSNGSRLSHYKMASSSFIGAQLVVKW